MEDEALLDREEDGSSSPEASVAVGLNQWLYQLIRHYVRGKVLEIDSKDGNMSALFVKDELALRISDSDSMHCQALQNRFDGEVMIKGIHQLDLSDPAFEIVFPKFSGRFDTVVLLNSADQNSKDRVKMNNAKKLLGDRGRLILLLPVNVALFGKSDAALEEWRQSNRKYIGNLLGGRSKFLKTQFFAVSDIQQIEHTHSYARDIPIFFVSEEETLCKTGLYVLVVARKYESASE